MVNRAHPWWPLRGPSVAIALATLLLALPPGSAFAAFSTIAAESGVRVTVSDGADAWKISNDLIEAEVGFDAAGQLTLRRFAHRGENRLTSALPDGTLAIGGQPRYLANDARHGIPLVAAGVEGVHGGLRLWLRFEAPGAPSITRSYACYGNVPVIEMWSDVRGRGASYRVDPSPVLQVAVAGSRVLWTRGIQPGHAAVGFHREEQWLTTQPVLSIGGDGRSTETAIPLMTVSQPGGVVFAGLIWSGAWTGRASRQGGSTHLQVGLAGGPMAVAGDEDRPFPHAFLGASDDEAAMASDMRRFVVEGLRAGRGFEALTTYNSWFAHGTAIDDGVIRDEMEMAAGLGIELFEVDAGWYEGAGRKGTSDFASGLGSWAVDEARFPAGLYPLGDYARRLGMRFGVWAEPERVDLALVGRPDGVDPSWLASVGGAHHAVDGEDTSAAALICLANRAARDWVLEHLAAFIEATGADYLKWDSNFWLNCDREGHGHDGANGNAAHIQGLYEVLGALRERFPNLLIENCATGGFRLDFGLLRYTDAAWMDDRSGPSLRVRQHLQGLGPSLPAAYLLSYAMASGGEALNLQGDLHAIVRSRMPGVLGFTYRASEVEADTAAVLADEVARYKQLREIVRDGATIVLTPQTDETAPPPWEAHEVVTDAGHALVFVFQNDAAVASLLVRARGLEPAAVYEVIRVGEGPIGEASGETLMVDGFEVTARPDTASQIFELKPRLLR